MRCLIGVTNQKQENRLKHLLRNIIKIFKKPEQDKEFTPGDRISYASRVYDEKEMMALTDATLDFGSQQEDFQISLKRNLPIGSVSNMHI